MKFSLDKFIKGFVLWGILILVLFSLPLEASADYALYYNGGPVNYATMPSLNVGTVFTVEGWFYQDTLYSYRTLLKDSWTGTNFGSIYSDPVADQTDISWWWNGALMLSAYNLNILTWHHFALVADGSTVKLYINAVLKDSVSASPTYNNTLKIGETDEGSPWHGKVDELRIYNSALSESDIQAHYQKDYSAPTSGIVAIWHFNNGTGTVTYDSSGYQRNGTISGATWTEGVGIEGSPPEPIQEEGISGTQSSSYGIENHSPVIEFETTLSGTYGGEVPISYTASDYDSGTGGLTSQPISISYTNNKGLSWNTVSENQLNTGTYIFDTTNLSDGKNYKIRLVAIDGYQWFGTADSETFAIDNTSPTFDIIVSPLPVKEKITITLKVISSEELKEPPEVKVTQQEAESMPIMMRGSSQEFIGSYEVLKDYRGKAIISVSGKDLVGNVGNIITSGKSFSVERYGPPAPIIKEPLNNQVFIKQVISVVGVSEPNAGIIITLNGVTEFTAKSLDDGVFRVDNIRLNTANKGINTLSIIAVNENGEEGEEVVLKIKVNSPPKISSDLDSLEKTISGEQRIAWDSSDPDDDELTFFIEYSNDNGVSWDVFVSDLSRNFYTIDTTELADGTNYVLRVTADDGAEKVSDTSKRLTIKNNLPHIDLNIPLDYFTNDSTPTFNGKITGSEKSISLVEYSLDRGETWRRADPIDGRFDSLIEEVEIRLTDFLNDGRYSILVKTEDVLKRSVKISRSFTVDTIPPTKPVIKFPLPNTSITEDQDINKQLDGLQIEIQGAAEPEAVIDFILGKKKYEATANEKGIFNIKNVTLENHGSNEFSLSSSDSAGNVSETTGALVLNNLPELFILNPAEGAFFGGKGEINWQIEDKDKDSMVSYILYQKESKWISLAKDLSSKEWPTNVYNWNVSGISNGDHKIKVIVSDGIGRTEEIVNVVIDSIAPEIEFKSSGSVLSAGIQPVFSGYASDDFSGVQDVEYSLDDVNWFKALAAKNNRGVVTGFEFQLRHDLEDGIYDVRVRATDKASNIGYAESVKLVIDTTPPRIGSYLISSGALAIFPDEEGFIKLFKNNNYEILVSVSKDAKEISLVSREINLNLDFNKSTFLWESVLNFKEEGNYPLELTTEDELGNSQVNKKIATIKVIPLGRVYSEKDGQLIKGAKATLYVFDKQTNSWLVWDSQVFNQQNPQFTNQSGEYGFLVPSGKYQVKISKPGFGTVKSQELEIEKSYLIGTDISLAGKGALDTVLDYFLNIIGLGE